MENLKKSFLVRGNNIVGFSGSGEENTIESISVNGVDITPDENKNVDITVPSIDGLAKTEDIPTKVSELTNDSGYLTEHQDISGKVDKVEGKSLISDTEIARLASVDNYDDTDIKAEIAKKADTTSIPSKVSELTNDSNYQTAEQVNNTVTTGIAKVVADAPEDFNTLKEMSDWIAGHEDDASAMNSAISDNKTAITALQTNKADKSEIPTTLPANGGNADTVNNHTVETDVPKNAVFTDTIYDDTEMKGSVEELNSNLVEQKMLGWTVPSECPVQNEVSGNQFIQKVGRVDLGSLDWTYLENDLRFYATITEREPIFENNTDIYCSKYATVIISSDNADKTIGSAYHKTPSDIGVRDLSYTDATAFKSANNGVYVYYELATPITKTIDGNEAITKVNESLAYNASKNMLLVNVGTISGVTITSKDKSTALLNGTSTANVSVFTTADVIPSGSYHLKLSNKVGSIFVWDTIHSKTIIDVDNTECNFTLTEPSKLLVGFSVGNGHSFTNFEASGQLEKGTVATDFVPYNGKSNLELTNDVVNLKNNLDTLEYSEVAGGKNLANINDFKLLTTNPSRYGYEWLGMKGGTYTFNITNGNNTLYIGYKHNGEFANPSSVKNGSKVQTITISDGDDILIWYDEGVTENTVTKIQLEVGSIATEYEPYIPSVKMLADEVNAQNESLCDYGLNNKFDGVWNAGSLDEFGNFYLNDNTSTSNYIPCNPNSDITIKVSNVTNYFDVCIAEYTDSSFIKDSAYTIEKGKQYISIKVSSTTTRIRIVFYNVIPSSALQLNTAVYLNNAIDELKNDLYLKTKEVTINSTTTDYSYSGFSFTLDKTAEVGFYTTYNNTYCKGIVVNENSSSIVSSSFCFECSNQNTLDLPLYTTPRYILPAGTYYVFAKHSVAGKTTEKIKMYYSYC